MNEENEFLPAAGVSRRPCEVWDIEPAKGLDRIHVFWMDVAPGAGYVTIICYGQAWTAYFGAMGANRTIKTFFSECGTDYLSNAMRRNPSLKKLARDEAYLCRIVDAVREALVQARRLPSAAGNTITVDIPPGYRLMTEDEQRANIHNLVDRGEKGAV